MWFRVFAIILVSIFVFGEAQEAPQWPAVNAESPEFLPEIELSLAPPAHPWPQVTSALGNLEEKREQFESVGMEKLHKSYDVVLSSAKKRIGEVIGRAMRIFDDAKVLRGFGFDQANRRKALAVGFFAQQPLKELAQLGEILTVKVNVPPVAPPDPILKVKIEQIERKRTGKEENMFDQAVEEMKGLTDLVLAELEGALQAQISKVFSQGGFVQEHPTHSLTNVTSFMDASLQRQLPKQVNVRSVASDTRYPTVASMVADMQQRRDISEYLEQQFFLEKELELLMAENTFILTGMTHAVERVLAQYSSLVNGIHALS